MDQLPEIFVIGGAGVLVIVTGWSLNLAARAQKRAAQRRAQLEVATYRLEAAQAWRETLENLLKRQESRIRKSPQARDAAGRFANSN